MPDLFKSLGLAVSASVFTLSAWAANVSPAQQADVWFTQAVASPTVPGINVAVADTGGVVWAKGYGYADLENQVPMSPKTKMRIGSVAKLITAAGLMRLYDEGKIDLDKPVSEYVPYWPKDKPVMTLRQLTSHTAGIRHYKEGADEFLYNRPFADVKAGVELFADDPLLYLPGEGHSYSTFAWTLISAVMEGADGFYVGNGRDFHQIIQQEVFTPLQMQDSAFDDQYQIISNRQRPYSVKEGKLINSPQTDHSYKWAGGGFLATPSDISRFAVAHTQGEYLKPDTVKQMFTKAKLNNGQEVNFGIGWMVGFDDIKDGKKYRDDHEAQTMMANMPHAVMHSGGSMGGITMTILCLDHQRAVTVVKNVDGDNSANVFRLALQTLSAYHNAS